MAKGTSNRRGCGAKASARATVRRGACASTGAIVAQREYEFDPVCFLGVRIVDRSGEPFRSLRFGREMAEPTIEEGKLIALDMMFETDFRLVPMFSGVAPDGLRIQFRDLVAGDETDELVERLYDLGWADDR